VIYSKIILASKPITAIFVFIVLNIQMLESKAKKVVLLVNLGTPNSPERKDVYHYLKQFLLDPRVIDLSWLKRNILVRGIIAPFRSKSSSDIYKLLWTEDGSPLKVYGEKVAKMLQDSLADDYQVELAMRYQNPSMDSVLEKIKSMQPESITLIPLFPQYASASTGSVIEEFMRIVSKWQIIPEIKSISSFHNHPDLIKIFSDNARLMDYHKYDHLLFSFHGIPQRQLIKADECNHCLKTEGCCQTISSKNHMCYSAQCFETARLIAEELDLTKDNYTVGFQSRLGKDPWTQPFTPDVIEDLQKKGNKKILVFSPSFVADCLETIVEIGIEYKEDYVKSDDQLIDLVPSLNDNKLWVGLLKKLVIQK
jgi:ferrochelatase